MQKLKFINAKNVEIDFTSGHYGVTDWSGLSNTGLDVQSQQTPFTDGSIYLDALLENREISVTVAMNDENDMSKRYEYRRELISALNPKLGEGYLIYENDFLSKRIKCVSQLPIIPNKNSDENGTLKISCSFTCCNPYWEDLEETTEIIENNERAFIVNRGDIPAQIKAEILTTYAKNPRLVNFTTDKKLGLSGVINKDVFINTNQGEKEVYSENIVYQTDLLTGDLTFITYSETQGKFVAVGYSGTILQSTDGLNWSSHQLSGYFHDSVLVNGTLHIVGTMIIHSTVDTTKQENLINRVTTDSDVGLNLAIGENELALIKSGGNASVKLTFRNRYVGL